VDEIGWRHHVGCMVNCVGARSFKTSRKIEKKSRARCPAL